MFLLRDVNPLSLKLLNRIYRESRHHQVRQRAHFLSLVSQGVKNQELMKIFKVSYKTMYNWLNRWESEAMLGLYNKPGRGRKQTFDSTQLAQIRDWVKSEPIQLKQAVQKIQQGKDSDLKLGKKRRHEKVTRMGRYSIPEKSHCTFTLKPTSLNHR